MIIGFGYQDKDTKMKTWTKILPFFFVEWYAKKNAECWRDSEGYFVYPYDGVKIYIDE